MSLFDTDILSIHQNDLPLQCDDVGALAEIKGLLEAGSEAWRRAQVFVGFYQSLDKVMQANAVGLCHGLRRYNEVLGNAPFYLIVDKGTSTTCSSTYRKVNSRQQNL